MFDRVLNTPLHIAASQSCMENVPENGETFMNSSQKRPPGVISGGSGNYCCVRQFGSGSYDKHKQKSGIRFFKFTENAALL